MIDIGVLYMGGGPICDRQQLLDTSPSPLALNSGISLPERFPDRAGQALPGGTGDRLCELMGFPVFNVEAH